MRIRAADSEWEKKLEKEFTDAYEGYLEELDPEEKKWLEEHPAKDPTIGNGVVEIDLGKGRSGE